MWRPPNRCFVSYSRFPRPRPSRSKCGWRRSRQNGSTRCRIRNFPSSRRWRITDGWEGIHTRDICRNAAEQHDRSSQGRCQRRGRGKKCPDRNRAKDRAQGHITSQCNGCRSTGCRFRRYVAAAHEVGVRTRRL